MIDNDDDGEIGVIKVTSYTSMVIKSTNIDDKKIYNATPNSTPVVFDDDDYYEITDTLGNEFEFEDLKADQVISLAISDDQTVYDVIVSYDYVDGKLSSVANDGVNSIKFDGGNFTANTTQNILGGLRLKLVDPAPTIASISGMEKPCKNETFTLSAVVTDNAALASVTYKIGDGAEVAMTAGADNTYTAPVALTAVGDNVITVTATDAAGQVSTKTHTIECVEFKVSAPTITPITSGENTIYAGSITINNQSSLPITMRVIVAVYDANNVMVGYKSEKYQIGVGTSPTVEASAMVPTAAGYRVEVMAWDSFVNMNELLVTPYGE